MHTPFEASSPPTPRIRSRVRWAPLSCGLFTVAAFGFLFALAGRWPSFDGMTPRAFVWFLGSLFTGVVLICIGVAGVRSSWALWLASLLTLVHLVLFVPVAMHACPIAPGVLFTALVTIVETWTLQRR